MKGAEHIAPGPRPAPRGTTRAQSRLTERDHAFELVLGSALSVPVQPRLDPASKAVQAKPASVGGAPGEVACGADGPRAGASGPRAPEAKRAEGAASRAGAARAAPEAGTVSGSATAQAGPDVVSIASLASSPGVAATVSDTTGLPMTEARGLLSISTPPDAASPGPTDNVVMTVARAADAKTRSRSGDEGADGAASRGQSATTAQGAAGDPAAADAAAATPTSNRATSAPPATPPPSAGRAAGLTGHPAPGEARPGTPAQVVTVRFTGEEGLQGQVRVALRGPALRATIVAPDAESARHLESGLGELRRALGEHGFREARLSVQQTGASRAEEPRSGAHERDPSRREDPADRSGGRRQENPDSSHDYPRRRPSHRHSER